MRLLVLAARPPQADGKGDQVRLAQIVGVQAERHDITVLYPVRRRTRPTVDPMAEQPRWREAPVPTSVAARAAGAVAAWLRGDAAQAGWFYPARVRRAARRAAADADLVLFVTARCHVETPTTSLIDHIDALSLNAQRRAGAQRLPPLRFLWRCEARRMRRRERRIAAGVREQIVICAADAAALPSAPPPVVIPNGVARTEGPVSGDDRDVDVVLSGNMRYPPNRDAAQWLTDEVAPRLAAHRPGVRIAIVGRDAGRLPVRHGIEVYSDVPAVLPYLCRAKVAAAPLRLGTGLPNKILDAARAGAAVVMTPEANAGLALSEQAVGIAADAGLFAAEVLRLLENDELRRHRVRMLWRELERFDLERVQRDYAAVLAAGADRRSVVPAG